MIKRFILISFILFGLMVSTPRISHAISVELHFGKVNVSIQLGGREVKPLKKLVDNIQKMGEQINSASRRMMMLADMIICNSRHGEAAHAKITVLGITLVDLKLIAFNLWVAGWILYVLGFMVSLVSTFYIFDVAFNLSLSLILLPIAIALWPFSWTKDKLTLVIRNVLYYTGIFIFLPFGILLSVKLVESVALSAITGGQDLMEIFDNDQADLIEDMFGLFSLSFLKVVIAYVVALKIIPLMAKDFCSHFFTGPLAGSPLHDKLSQLTDKTLGAAVGKVTKWAKDTTKHQAGEAIKGLGDKNGNLMQRAMYRYGQSVSKTNRKGK